jgi:hypothetical protein
MKVSPILKPLPGEGVVGADPPLGPFVPADWRRRLNCYVGRTLSDTALTAEQAERARRLATLGQKVSAGVVRGLAPALEPGTGDPAGFLLHIAAGLGLAATGEDVVLTQAARVNVRDVPVYATAAQLGKPPEEHTPTGLLPRYVGPPLGEVIAAGRPLPPAGVFVLQPVVGERGA